MFDAKLNEVKKLNYIWKQKKLFHCENIILSIMPSLLSALSYTKK